MNKDLELEFEKEKFRRSVEHMNLEQAKEMLLLVHEYALSARKMLLTLMEQNIRRNLNEFDF